MKTNKKQNYLKQRGAIIIPALIFGCIAIISVTALISWASLNLKLSRQAVKKEQALQIAEAGNDYYRWHLAHDKTDFKDGTSGNGPYTHDFKDKDGNVLGQFSLEITAPQTGSTVAAIKSTGRVAGDAATERHIQTRLAIPTLAKYAVASNSEVRFGIGTEIFGPIHSNNGIRFDGLAHNIVSSSKSSYLDPDTPQDTSFGVHTHIVPADPTMPPAPLPPPAVPSRPDVFAAGRQLSVAQVDFAGLTPDLQNIKNAAETSGKAFGASGKSGYRLVLKNDNTFDAYKVKSVNNPPSGCSSSESGWGTWTPNSEQSLGNFPIPANGLIFVEDDVWVEGIIANSRVTIAAARFPDVDSTRASITINKNLVYTNYDGKDAIGLIAQKNINIGLDSANDLRIDAALIAQNGRVGRYYYDNNCGTNYLRNSITLFGMIASNTRYGFSWICEGTTHCSGYSIRNINYNPNLLYSAPPSFPTTSDQYETISWDEVK